MITENSIKILVDSHKSPYIYNSNNFIPGITPIYYSGPYWDNNELEAAIDAILNGKWISAGERVNEFEYYFSEKFNVKYSVMTNSGSSANLILIAALKKYFKWNDNDEIILSPVGFPTTISVVYHNKLKPVFIDIEWDTLNFDIDKIEEKITNKTRAIFVSPVLGNPPNIDKLIEICKIYNLQFIGDNCDSLGTKWDDKYLNEYYVAFSNSFYPAHHISTGEGGMVSTNKKEIRKIFNSMIYWGRDCTCIGASNLLTSGSCGNRFDNWLENYDGIIDHKYVFSNLGYNLKPLDLQGAIGIEQLKKFEEIVTNRKTSKNILESIFLSNIPEISGVKTLMKSDVSWFGTPFICNKDGLKNKLVSYLEMNHIQTRNYFAGNILLHPGYKFMDDYKLYPEANKVLDNVFFIGASPHYNADIFNYVEDIIKKYK